MKKIFLSFIVIFVFATNVWAGDYYSVGVGCFKKGDYQNAQYNFECAVKISPKNVNARYYLAQVYLVQKKLPEATNQYNRIIILAPSSVAARLSQKGLSLIAQSYEANSKGATISNNLSAYSDNYLDYVFASDGALKKWSTFPVKVYIQPKKQSEDVKKAFNQWQEQTNNLVSFNFAKSIKGAQITVDFKDKLESTSTKESYIAGFSKPYYKGNSIVKSEIHILTIDPDTKKDIPDNDIYFSALHEIGHSLGFKGHSPDTNDVMAAQSTAAKLTLTKRDINTMNLLYISDQKTLSTRGKRQSDVKLQQALDYVKNTPNKSVGWANLGDIYRGKKMYSEAIINYKKAISIEPDKAELYNLIGTAYSESGDYKNAFENLKKACDKDKSNSFYLYQFGQICVKTGQKQIGKSYVDAFIKANPQEALDEKIQSLLKQL